VRHPCVRYEDGLPTHEYDAASSGAPSSTVYAIPFERSHEYTLPGSLGDEGAAVYLKPVAGSQEYTQPGTLKGGNTYEDGTQNAYADPTTLQYARSTGTAHADPALYAVASAGTHVAVSHLRVPLPSRARAPESLMVAHDTRTHSLQELFTIWQVMQHLSPNTRGRAARRTPATTAWPLQVAPQVPTTTAWPARTATPRVESGNADAHAWAMGGFLSLSTLFQYSTDSVHQAASTWCVLDSHLAARLLDTRSPRVAS
jgi:hypothetical protein